MLNRSVDDDAHTVDDWFLRTIDRRQYIPRGAVVETKSKLIYIWKEHYAYGSRYNKQQRRNVRWTMQWSMTKPSRRIV